ncbi:hypothetical protein [Mucilaginibacter sp.]|uniref:hypothetical protein n=1 Tax=Mucilaginibacter sp. TaxID=1882438 RepID=UPI00374CF23A
MKYKYAFILFFVTVLLGCFSSRKSDGLNIKNYCFDSSLIVKVSSINPISLDSILVNLVITNNCKDTVIIMKDYTRPIFNFMNENIKGSSVKTAQVIPVVNWKESSKGAKSIYLQNRCRPLINYHDIIVIAPDQSEEISININSMGYHGFMKKTKYDFSVILNVPIDIKSYCPFIWSGYTKSVTYNFIIN